MVQNNYNGNANRIAAIFSIEEGPQWLVANLDLDGVEKLNKDALLSRLSESEGQPYSDVSVASDRNAILTEYHLQGFRRTTFQWSATPAAAPHQVDLRYKITEGRQEFVRDVLMTGLKTTSLDLVEKNLGVTSGDPLSSIQMRNAQRALYNLGIFAKIDTAVQNSQGDEVYKYVLFDFDEGHRYTVNVGVGAELARIGGTTDSLTAPAGATGFSPRVSLDVKRLNFFGLGHTAAFQTRVSSLQQRAALSYSFLSSAMWKIGP